MPLTQIPMKKMKYNVPSVSMSFGLRNPNTVGDRLTNTFTKDFLCLDKEHIFGGDQGDIPKIMDEILTTARDMELEVNEDDIEELIMGYEDELTIENSKKF
ncbi:uncharacterized protein TNCV_4829341 [Trichonephila clavipes]|nr:uncharacterized protein TNCV_4829341 [Trichonephila clavipes]